MTNKFKKKGLLVLLLMLSIAVSTTVNAQTNAQELAYAKVEVKGLACPFCAYGLEKKLTEEHGIVSIKIDVEEGLAYLSVLKSQQPTKEVIEQIVIDAGFTPGSIIFSEIPFTSKDEN